jgi:hypothetical protein
MENYICIGGNKVELTEEQIKQLGFEVKKKSPFERRRYGEIYYYILSDGSVYPQCDEDTFSDNKSYNTANYCADNTIMEQRSLHETLNRLLWRYSMEHNGDKIDIVNEDAYSIYYHAEKFATKRVRYHSDFGTVLFSTMGVARSAIKDVVHPFMKEHPEFKW